MCHQLVMLKFIVVRVDDERNSFSSQKQAEDWASNRATDSDYPAGDEFVVAEVKVKFGSVTKATRQEF